MRLILAILAGGRSSRFGSSKLHVRVNDKPILQWVRERFTNLTFAETILSLSPDAPLPPDSENFTRIIRDATPHDGPLAGIRQILTACSPTDLVLITAADMPAVSPAHVQSLLTLLLSDPAATATMSRLPSGHIQPLPSAWRAGPAVELITRAAATGITGPSKLASFDSVRILDVTNPQIERSFTSLNFPSDLPTLSAQLHVPITPPPS